MLGTLRKLFRKNLFIRKLVGYHLASSGLFDNYFRTYKVSPAWKKRIDHVLSSSDNDFIPRVKDAGKIISGRQILHNGIKVNLGSYYGPEYSRMLMMSKGVHEPQEERVFMEVLKTLPAQAVMIEMGAFWSFYSMWFNKEIEGAVNFMIEPDEFNMGQGQRNFRLNGLKGKFVNAFIGSESIKNGGTPTLSVDDIIRENAIEFVHLLHSDIQGYEYEMLQGAKHAIEQDKIGYIFISTHSNDIHSKCVQFLIDHGFEIIAAADIDESFSEDGLIVASAPHFKRMGSINISKRTKRN
jgi:hypothetical protein